MKTKQLFLIASCAAFLFACKKKEDETTTSGGCTIPCITYKGDATPQIGDELYLINDTTSTVDAKSEGQAQEWDLTHLVSQRIDTAKFVDPSTKVGSSNYPTANIFAEMGEVGLFLNKKADGVEAVGAFVTISGLDMDVKLDDTYKLINFPVSLGDSISDDYSANDVKENVSFPFNGLNITADSVIVRRTGNVTRKFDACGSIKTPKGTYNVLRAYVTESSIDTVDALVDITFPIQIKGWQRVYTSTESSRRYEFYANEEKLPVATIHLDKNNVPKSASYLK